MKFKLKASNTYIALALLAYAGSSFAASPSTEELQKQIEELKSIVHSLQHQAANAPVSASPSIDTEQLATKDDIGGLRADLENYKYDTQRLRDTKSALTTRGTTISG